MNTKKIYYKIKKVFLKDKKGDFFYFIINITLKTPTINENIVNL